MQYCSLRISDTGNLFGINSCVMSISTISWIQIEFSKLLKIGGECDFIL
jgi:hypothetical protein